MSLTGQEYFGHEEHDHDMENIVGAPGYKIIAQFNGEWFDELDVAISHAKKMIYTDRGEHNDYLYITKMSNKMPKLNKMASLLGFENVTNNQIQMQRPGCLMPRHKDPAASFGDPNDPGVRVLVTLAHWEWGQFMFFNDNIVKYWKPGTVIYADFVNTYHCTCNCSSHTRPLLQITGKPSAQLKDLINSNQILNINI